MPRLSTHATLRIAKALADTQRCRILERIAAAHDEMCCSDLVSCFPVSQATVSHHLKELVAAELVDRRKDGQFAYFRFREDVMLAYLDELKRRLHLGAAVGAGGGRG
jgi:DNA-binding transcriptional ArsR family regulator